MCVISWSDTGVPAELHSNLVALIPSCSTVSALKLEYNRGFLCKSCMLTIGLAKEKICRAGVWGGGNFPEVMF